MNILCITTTYPTPTRPRQGMFNRNLIEALRIKNDVRVIAPIPWTERIRSPRLGPIGNHAPHDFYPTYVYPPKVLRNQYDRFYWQSILPELRRLKRSFRPDLVMSYWLHPDGLAAQRAAKLFDAPCVAVSGGSDLQVLTGNSSRRQAIRCVLSETECLVVVSKALAVKAVELGMSPKNIDVVYRGIDHACFHPGSRIEARDACGLPQDSVVIVWSGRMEPIKNPKLLFRAAVKWQQKWGDRLRVMIAGDGSMRNELVKLRSHLGLDRCIRFEGNLSQRQLAIRYNAADVMVLTSHSEGIPNVLLESIACGVPFVATEVGGISEIATRGVDHLVPDNDTNRLAEAVTQQIESPCVAKRSFVPDGLIEMASRFEAIFDRVLSSRDPDTSRVE